VFSVSCLSYFPNCTEILLEFFCFCSSSCFGLCEVKVFWGLMSILNL
jgi:hypothetical protein